MLLSLGSIKHVNEFTFFLFRLEVVFMEAATTPKWKPIHPILNTLCKGQLCLRSKEDEIEDFGKLFHFFLE